MRVFPRKTLDKQENPGYNNKAVPSGTLPDCVKVARQTLTLFVWVRILVGQPTESTGVMPVLLLSVSFGACSGADWPRRWAA